MGLKTILRQSPAGDLTRGYGEVFWLIVAAGQSCRSPGQGPWIGAIKVNHRRFLVQLERGHLFNQVRIGNQNSMIDHLIG